MKIFIWKNYGIIDVYQVDTIEQLQDLLVEICTILIQIGELPPLEYQEMIIPTTNKELIKLISNLILLQIGTHETFEYGTNFGDLK